MAAVRQLFDGKDYAGAMRALAQYRAPMKFTTGSGSCWRSSSGFPLPKRPSEMGGAIRSGTLEAVAALGKDAALLLRRLGATQMSALLARIQGQVVNLPGLDEALTVQATSALAGGDVQRAAHLLDGAEDRTAPCWNFLRGKCHMALEEFPEAAKCFLAAEGSTTSSGSWRSATGKWAITKTPTFMSAVRRTRNNKKNAVPLRKFLAARPFNDFTLFP